MKKIRVIISSGRFATAGSIAVLKAIGNSDEFEDYFLLGPHFTKSSEIRKNLDFASSIWNFKKCFSLDGIVCEKAEKDPRRSLPEFFPYEVLKSNLNDLLSEQEVHQIICGFSPTIPHARAFTEIFPEAKFTLVPEGLTAYFTDGYKVSSQNEKYFSRIDDAYFYNFSKVDVLFDYENYGTEIKSVSKKDLLDVISSYLYKKDSKLDIPSGKNIIYLWHYTPFVSEIDQDICDSTVEIINNLTDLGYSVLFKPHPRDTLEKVYFDRIKSNLKNSDKFNHFPMHCDLPIEFYFTDKNKVSAIASVNSTSLFLASDYFGIPSYVLPEHGIFTNNANTGNSAMAMSFYLTAISYPSIYRLFDEEKAEKEELWWRMFPVQLAIQASQDLRQSKSQVGGLQSILKKKKPMYQTKMPFSLKALANTWETASQSYLDLIRLTLKGEAYWAARILASCANICFSNSKDLMYMRFLVYLRTGEFQKAKEISLKLQKAWPTSWQGYWCEAQIYHEAGDLETAMPLLRRAVQHFPKNKPDVFKNRYQELLREPRKRTLHQIHSKRSVSYFQNSAGLAIAERYMERFPNDKWGYQAYADALSRLNMISDAIVAYRNLHVEFDTDELSYLVVLINHYIRDQDFAQARKTIDAAVRQFSTELRTLDASARLAIAEQDYRTALSYYQDIRAAFPKSIVGYAGILNSLILLEQIDEAEVFVEECQRLFPTAKRFDFLAYEVSIKAQKFDKTREILAAYRTKYPKDEWGHLRQAELFLLSGRFDDAKRALLNGRKFMSRNFLIRQYLFKKELKILGVLQLMMAGDFSKALKRVKDNYRPQEAVNPYGEFCGDDIYRVVHFRDLTIATRGSVDDTFNRSNLRWYPKIPYSFTIFGKNLSQAIAYYYIDQYLQDGAPFPQKTFADNSEKFLPGFGFPVDADLANPSHAHTLVPGDPKHYTFENVRVHASQLGLYDAGGELLPSSAMVRMMTQATPHEWYGDKCADVDRSENIQVVDEPILFGGYLGLFTKHYGHFLYEDINRLWYAIKSGWHGKILFFELGNWPSGYLKGDDTFEAVQPLRPFSYSQLPSHVIEIFSLLGITEERVIFANGKDLLLKSVVIPLPSHGLRFAFEGKKVIFDKLVESASSLNIAKKTRTLMSENIYLSYRVPKSKNSDEVLQKSNNRDVQNEDILEDILSENGFTIVRPSTLSETEKVHIYNSAKSILVMEASSIAGLSYCRQNPYIYILGAISKNGDCREQYNDLIGLNFSVYSSVFDDSSRGFGGKRILNIERVIELLKNEGLIPEDYSYGSSRPKLSAEAPLSRVEQVEHCI